MVTSYYKGVFQFMINRILSLIVALACFAAMSPAMAADKAVVKVGSVQYKTTSSDGNSSIIAAEQANFVNITIGGSKGFNSGTVTLLVPSSELANPTKGQEISIFGTGNDADNSVLVFLVTKIQGLSGSVGFSSNNDTSITGDLKVVSYNSATKELKFTVKAKASPYSQVTTKFGGSSTTKDISKSIAISISGVVTLP